MYYLSKRVLHTTDSCINKASLSCSNHFLSCMCVLGGREFGKSEMLWWSNNSDGFPWLTSLSKFCGFLGNILFHGLLFFWSEHCSTTRLCCYWDWEFCFHSSLLGLWGNQVMAPFEWEVKNVCEVLMMVNLVFHCISFHSNQLRTADL